MRRTRMFPYPRIRPGVSIPGAAIESLPGGAVAVYDFGRTNFMNFSEDLANASWSKAGATIDASSPLLVGYEGQSVSLSTYTSTNSNQSANGLVSTSTTGGLTVSAGQLVYASVFAAPITGPSTAIVITTGTTQLFVTFNFATKTFTTVTGVAASTRFEELPGGVFRLIVGWVATSALNLKTHAGYVNGALAIRLGGISLALNERYEKQTDGQALLDRSGNNNNGTLGSTAGVDVSDPAWVVQGLLFDGTEDYVQLTNAPAGTGTGETFTFLVPGATGRAGEVATVYSQSQQSAGPTPYVWIYFTSNAITLQLADGTARVTLTFSTVAVGSLVTLTVDYASGRIRYYVNGTLVTPIIHTRSILPLAVGNARIGAYMLSLTHTASGTQSWLSRHSRALTDAEVAQAYRVIRRTLAARGVALP